MTLERVVVHPDNWTELSGLDQATYTAAAQSWGVVLEIGADGANPDAVVLFTDEGLKVAPDFLGIMRCGRPAWEHSLREVFYMPDPCFPA